MTPTPRTKRTAEPYVKLPTRVLANDTLSDRAVRLYGILANYQGPKRYSYALRSTLAGMLSCSLKSVDRALRELVDAGELRKTQRTGPSGSLISSLFELQTSRRDTGDATLGTPVSLARDTGDAQNQNYLNQTPRTRSVGSGLSSHQRADLVTDEDDFDCSAYVAQIRTDLRSNR